MADAKAIRIPDGWVTLSEWARRRGCSKAMLSKAIAAGKVPSARRFGVNLAVDPVKAEAELQASTDSTRGGDRTPRRGRPPGSKNKKQETETPPLPPPPDPDEGDPAAPPENLTQAKTRHEIIKASLAELELAEKEGRLVDRSKVEAQAFRVARLVRDNMLNIPDRLAGTLAALTDPHQVHEALTKEIRMALEGLTQ